MFGMRFIKSEPTQHILYFRNGKLRREGAGLSFFYFAPTAGIALVPTASAEEPFIVQEITANFQEVTVQGQVSYRVNDPQRLARMMNFNLDAKGKYASEDPTRLAQRILHQVQVLMRSEIQALDLQAVLAAGESLGQRVGAALAANPVIAALGVEILGLSVIAVKPKPETTRALEAEAREALLRRADEATYARRNAAVEQERAIKENELSTEVAVENKRRQVREAQMDAERAVQAKQQEIERAGMEGKIELEQRNRELVGLVTENARAEADAKAYAIAAAMKAFAGADPIIVQALATNGMQPDQIIAAAFRSPGRQRSAHRRAQHPARPAARPDAPKGGVPGHPDDRPAARHRRSPDTAGRADRALQHRRPGALLRREPGRRFRRLSRRA